MRDSTRLLIFKWREQMKKYLETLKKEEFTKEFQENIDRFARMFPENTKEDNILMAAHDKLNNETLIKAALGEKYET